MIKLTNLEKIYRTKEIETVALENVNLDIQKGEFLSIMGLRLRKVHLAEHHRTVGCPDSRYGRDRRNQYGQYERQTTGRLP